MSTVRDRIDEAVRLLAEVSDTPRADAEFLMAHALGVSRAQLAAHLHRPADVPEYRIMVERRLACEPVPYILGEWEFYSVPLKTRAPVLVPRPETEHLVESALDVIAHERAQRKSFRVLDLCTGSGCVAVAIALNAPDAHVIATDISDDAVLLAEENVVMHRLTDRVIIRRGDLFDALHNGDAPFDILVANPPYVEEPQYPRLSATIRLYEDPAALVAGPDGLDVIRRIIARARDILRDDGFLALEIGEAQYDAVSSLMRDAGYCDIGVRCDLAGIRRIAGAYCRK